MTTVAAASKAGAALKARDPGPQSRHRLHSGPPHRLLGDFCRPKNLSHRQFDRPGRAMSIVTTIADATKAGAALRARDPGPQSRHRLLSGPPHRPLGDLCKLQMHPTTLHLHSLTGPAGPRAP